LLPKGNQSCQSTTMLHNECMHTFLYVFRHCVENICWICCWYWYQNLGVPPPPGLRVPFLDSDTCAEGDYLFLPGFFFPVRCHPWMDDETDGWMNRSHDEKASRKTITTSFTVCNIRYGDTENESVPELSTWALWWRVWNRGLTGSFRPCYSKSKPRVWFPKTQIETYQTRTRSILLKADNF
jgi:hypothetical protein